MGRGMGRGSSSNLKVINILGSGKTIRDTATAYKNSQTAKSTTALGWPESSTAKESKYLLKGRNTPDNSMRENGMGRGSSRGPTDAGMKEVSKMERGMAKGLRPTQTVSFMSAHGSMISAMDRGNSSGREP